MKNHHGHDSRQFVFSMFNYAGSDESLQKVSSLLKRELDHTLMNELIMNRVLNRCR
jgi:hypothetical protein